MYNVRIGLEIHVELNTKSKMFCACSTDFSQAANTNCCPICMGLLGALPSLNQQAVFLSVKTALLLNSQINRYSHFDRKQYTYLDLPKGYQITQYHTPYAVGGEIHFGKNKVCTLDHIHMEEDAGKLLHENNQTKIDFNRASVPLLEIVTTPCLHSADDVKELLEHLHELLVYNDITSGKIQEGAMRCDINVSLHKNDEKSERVEIKNVAGFHNAKNAVLHEIERQKQLLHQGKKIVRQTRGWDDSNKTSHLMREKKDLPNYRYFYEYDLGTLLIDQATIQKAQNTIKEAPSKIREVLQNTYHLSEKESAFLYKTPLLLHFYQQMYALYPHPAVLNAWVLGEVNGILNLLIKEKKISAIDEQAKSFLPDPDAFLSLILLFKEQKISKDTLKEVLYKHMTLRIFPQSYIEQHALYLNTSTQMEQEIETFLEALIKENTPLKNAYQNGKTKLLSFFVGQTLKKFPQADAKKVKEKALNLLQKKE